MQKTVSAASAVPPQDPLHIEVAVIDSFVRGSAKGLDHDVWDAFVQMHGGDLYMSYDWLRLWWEHYGKGRELRLFVGRNAGGEIVGLLPMFVETLWLGPVRLRWAKIVGCDFLPSVLSPVFSTSCASEVLRQAITMLIREDNCDAVALGPLSDGNSESGIASQVRVACAGLQDCATLEQDVQVAIHTTFQLPDTFDAYLGGLNKRQKQNLRRDMNLFSKNFTCKVDVASNTEELIRDFSAFRKMHDQQWHAENKLGHFGDWPGSGKFNEALVSTLAPLGRVRLVRLWANEQVASYQYCLTFGERMYWRLPARLAGEEWNRYGMGRLGLVKMIEAAIGEGIRWIEGGPGHYEYKMQLGGQEVPLISQAIVANSYKSRLCWKMFQKASRLLHLLYYRLWFVRIAPRLPLRRKPLWRIWIRSRL
jgi:CelD/BcsL family acetyltransferase involved in cellulose biosynthesis